MLFDRQIVFLDRLCADIRATRSARAAGGGVTLGAITSSPTTRSSLYTEIVGGVTTFVTMAFLQLDILGALRWTLPAIISILFTDLFDSLSTFIGVSTAAGLTAPGGGSLNLRRGLIVDAFATPGAGLDLGNVEDALPAFVTIVLIPLTLSITQGILWGFVLHALLYAATGRAREVSPALWALGALSAGLPVLGR